MTKVAIFFIYAQFFLTNLQNFITNPLFFVKKAKSNSFSLFQIRRFSHPRVDVGIDVLLQNRFIAPKYHPDLQCNSAAKNLLERDLPTILTLLMPLRPRFSLLRGGRQLSAMVKPLFSRFLGVAGYEMFQKVLYLHH